MVLPLSKTLSHCCYCGGQLNDLGLYAYVCTACDKKTYLSPALGCNCILIQGDTVLMTQRARHPDAGTWGLPGGFSHPSETCEETMIREAYEELGVAISVYGLVGSQHCDYLYEDISRPVMVVYGVGQIESGDIICQDDVSDYTWLTVDAIQSLPLFHPYEVEIIHKAMKLWNQF